mgnify:CR=1 FL=1
MTELRPDRETISRAISISNVAYQFIAAFGVCTTVGIWIDAESQTSPWGTLGGLAIGFSLAIYFAWKEIDRQTRKANRSRARARQEEKATDRGGGVR